MAVSLPDVARELSEHKAATENSFDGMKTAFEKATNQFEVLNKKQDDQIQTLNAQNEKLQVLLDQALESAVERGRRMEIDKLARDKKIKAEKRERRIKWALRFVIVPLVIGGTHYVEKWLSDGRSKSETQHVVPAGSSH